MGMEEGLFTGAYMLHTHQLFEQNWDILTQLKFTVFSCNSLKLFNSPWNSPWQSAFAESFAKANSVFIVITLVKIFSRWSFPSKIYIQFIIFNTYFSTKLLFTSKRYHLHVLEKCLYMLQEVRSIIYFRQFIHPLSLRSRGNGTSFAFTSYNHRIGEILWRHIFKQLIFCFTLLPFVQRQIKIRHMTLSKSYLYKFFF